MRPSLSKLILIAAAALIAALATAPAAAQGPACGNRAVITDFLKSRYAEQLHAFGLSTNGSLVEIFVSPLGTWTATVTAPGGETCVVAGGGDWHDVVKLPGQQAGHTVLR